VSRLLLPAGWEIPCWESQAAPGPGCQPTVIQPRWRGQDQDGAYRGACHECGWIGEVVASENAAAEHANDHAHPGWRELPVLTGYRYDDLKLMARLARELAPAFPVGWAERCGPVITWRTPPGTRHVPGHGLFGGYCMGRARPGAPAEHSAPATVVTTQLDLFG
jgi:hypothetical protein